MGGNVDLSPDHPLNKKFFNISQTMTKGTPNIGIIPSASANPNKTGEDYSKLFEGMGANTDIINPESRGTANDEEILNIVNKQDAFFFTGGHQLRITALLGGTKLLDLIEEKFENGTLLAGTSAGSVCMTEIMISQDLLKRPFVHGEVELTQGLGFIGDMIIDTHFTSRERFPRMIHVVCENPGILGIGIGDSTGALWDFDKSEFEVLGKNNVVVLDGKHIKVSNTPDLDFGEQLSVSDVRVHVVGKGSKFNYESGELTLPAKRD
ncbi:MAG: cyanophycinase [Thermoplasmatota archaeon]